MMNNTKKIYFILSALVTSLSCHSQLMSSKELFKNIENAVSHIKTVTYKIHRTDKNFALKDTLNFSAVCNVKIVDTDKVEVHYNINQKLNDSTYTNHKYDGADISYIYIQNDSLFSGSFIRESAKEKNYAYVNNNLKFTCNEFFSKKSGLLKHISSSKKK